MPNEQRFAVAAAIHGATGYTPRPKFQIKIGQRLRIQREIEPMAETFRCFPRLADLSARCRLNATKKCERCRDSLNAAFSLPNSRVYLAAALCIQELDQ